MAYIRTHPGCVAECWGGYKNEVCEFALLNPNDWTCDDGDSHYWENWSDRITWADGIRAYAWDGEDEICFEET